MSSRRRSSWLPVVGGGGAVDHATAAAFTREVVGIVERHGGSYDGWDGFLMTPDPDPV